MALGSLIYFYFIHSTDKATFICYICEVKVYKNYINNVEDFFYSTITIWLRTWLSKINTINITLGHLHSCILISQITNLGRWCSILNYHLTCIGVHIINLIWSHERFDIIVRIPLIKMMAFLWTQSMGSPKWIRSIFFLPKIKGKFILSNSWF